MSYLIKIKMSTAFFLMLLFFAVIPSLSYAGDATEKLTPTAAPEVPAMDFTTEFNQLKVGAGISYLKIDDAFEDGPLYIVTPGANFAFTKALTDKAGFSFGLGLYKQIIEDDSSDYDMDGSAMFFPFSASIAYRIAGDIQSNNTMIFAGVNYSYISMDLNSGTGDPFSTDVYVDSDMTITGAAYGMMFGVKTKFILSESFAVLPFAAIQYTGSSMDYDIDTTTEYIDGSGNTTETTSSDSGSVDADPVRSLILGFDLLFGNFSIGTMLDALSSADGNKITVSASYTFKM